jgi:hypothetical protein
LYPTPANNVGPKRPQIWLAGREAKEPSWKGSTGEQDNAQTNSHSLGSYTSMIKIFGPRKQVEETEMASPSNTLYDLTGKFELLIPATLGSMRLKMLTYKVKDGLHLAEIRVGAPVFYGCCQGSPSTFYQ